MLAGRYALWIGLLAALMAWCFALPRPNHAASSALSAVETATAVYASSEKKIEFMGKYQAADGDQVTFGSAAPSQGTKLLVKVGDHVKKGQSLAIVQASTVSQKSAPRFNAKSEAVHAEQFSDQLGAALTDHQVALDRAKAAFDQATKDRDAKVARAEAERDHAVNGTPSEQLSQAQHAVDDAQALRDKAKALSDRNQHAYEEGWISRNDATAAKNAYDSSESALKTAQSRLQDLKRGPSDSEVKALRDAFAKVKDVEDKKVEVAKSEWERIKNGGLAFGVSGPIVSPVLPSFSRGAIIGKIASRAQVRAPVDGVVTKLPVPGQLNLFEIVKDGAKCEFTGQLDASSGLALKPGMIVRLPEGQTGTVIAVGPVDTKTGLVAIRVACPPRTAFGPPAKATIALQSTSTHLTVPASAVFTTRDGSFVDAVDSGTIVRKPVVVNSLDGGRVSVLKGLREGETVVMSHPADHRVGERVSVRSN